MVLRWFPIKLESMNATSFALNGIALSMPKIDSAYAAIYLQILAMVTFSAWYSPDKMGEVAYAFSLIIPHYPSPLHSTMPLREEDMHEDVNHPDQIGPEPVTVSDHLTAWEAMMYLTMWGVA
ncbi:hypothetical protein BDP27DRAFT_1361199 [Rhodocollybia butyracea]|uniref:Uncharacterized protein n=1 Tax=Rhodocollybia butyracea TaxID=206335 RepID=A0A9P5PZK0_9AGAR|nr:hypothetical protein BDP27DRAFT_1361199 [Rhodocollybia butyracea]